MAKKRFTADIFSKSSIEKLKRDLQTYRAELLEKTEILCKRLAEIGVDIAKAQITTLDAVFTGELKTSITYNRTSSDKNRVVFVIVADNEHAVFVEFGTGMVGKQSPYPVPFPNDIDWKYASGEHIIQLKDGRYGWFYNRDGRWYFTEGMPSRPFMHNTSLEVQGQIVKIAKEVFQ